MTEKILFNHIGFWTLYAKETKRFLKVFNQTLLTPMITALLFLAIFSLAVGNHIGEESNHVNFKEFIACGLIIMAIVQQAFANTSSSLIMGKVLGIINDILVPPLSAAEIVIAYALAGITRGILVGLITGAAIMVFVPIHIDHPFLVIVFVILSSLMLSLLGMLAGLIADSFDQMAALTNYFITPMAFLSGTFYPIKALPEFWYKVSHLNPFFYMIDGFRYSMINYSDSSPLLGLAFLTTMNTALFTTIYILFKKGFRIKT